MKRLLLVLALTGPSLLAEEASAHRAAASKVVVAVAAIANPAAVAYAQVKTTLQKLRDRGMPEAGIAEMDAILKNFCDRAMTGSEYQRQWEEYYMSRFTTAELTQVVGFLESSAGKKIYTLAPEMQRLSADFAKAALTSIQADLAKEIREVERKYPLAKKG